MKTVQVYVSRLRRKSAKILCSHAAAATCSTWEPAQRDVERFERLAGDGGDALERGEAAGAASCFARHSALGVARRSRISRTSRSHRPTSPASRPSGLVMLEQRIEADSRSGVTRH